MTAKLYTFPRHKYYSCPGHGRPYDDATMSCPYCDWGAAYCTTCGAVEGQLTSDCPQRTTTQIEKDAVLGGQLDYTAEWGWEPKSARREVKPS